MSPPPDPLLRQPNGSFVHAQALCDSERIGAGTRIWEFARVLAGATIGADVNLCGGVFVEGDVVIGDRVTVKHYVALYDGVRLEDDVFVGPNVSFTNDLHPRSKRGRHPTAPITIRKGASIGAGAVILPGVEIGAYALVGAGAVVTRSVSPFTAVIGVPARAHGRVCCCGAALSEAGAGWSCTRGDWSGPAPGLDMTCGAAS